LGFPKFWLFFELNPFRVLFKKKKKKKKWLSTL